MRRNLLSRCIFLGVAIAIGPGASADVGYAIAPTLHPFANDTVGGVLTVTNNAASDGFLSNSEITSWNWHARTISGNSLSGSSSEAGATTDFRNLRITEDFVTLTPWQTFPNNTQSFSLFMLSNREPGWTDAKRFNYFNANSFGSPLTNAQVGNFDAANFNVLWNTSPSVTAMGGEPWTIATRLGSVGGNDTFFTVNAGNVIGGGDVETNDLGALHRGFVDSFGGIGLQTESSELTREFVFNMGDGGIDPVAVYVHGFVEGLMEADKFGRASLSSWLQILDLDGNVLGESGFEKSVETNALQVVNVDLFETYGFMTELTPGTTYVVKSLLSAEADGAAQGRGLVDLRNTFEYVLAGLSENPFADPGRMTVETVSSVPLPGALVLLLSGIAGICGLRRPKRVSGIDGEIRSR